MTIDVRITFANRAEAEILVAELRARAGAHRLASQTGILLDATARAVEICVERQRRFAPDRRVSATAKGGKL